MARRKQEVALQIELESQEDWENALSKEGLTIIDVYQEWAGPCTGMVSNFRRIKNELGDDLLRFAVAKADTIDSLERYRGKCEPCFLLYASGSLVCHVQGARAPVLSKVIPEQLAQEHKVLAGESERKAIRDPMFEEQPEKAATDAEESEKDEVEVEKEVTVCLIKPDAVEAGKVEEIIEQLEAHGMEILKQEVRQLTEEEARSFYAAHEGEEYFEGLITFMCSGPSHVLVLSEVSGENTISKFRDLIGPKMVEEAKEQAPESLRARYGSTSMTNAVHGSDNKDNAMKELAFFFPDYNVPTRKVVQKRSKVQRTLALIRPDALRDHKEDILNKIKESGFQIAFQKEVQLTKEQAEEFYKEHREEEYFEELTTRMSSGPLLALALARLDAVDNWRDMIGPKEIPKAKEEAPESLRAQFSVDEDIINCIHGSDSPDTAEQELNYFFPVQQTVAVVKPDAYQTKDEIIKRIHEAGFRIAARKETTLTKDIAGQMYEEHKDKEYYESLTDHLTDGQTLFLVLSREDAVDGWRSMIGPTDPAVAKEQAPSSIRAELGTDIEHNAVHGSSDPEHAKKEMHLLFGDMEFNEDGTLKGAEPDLDPAVVEKEGEEEGEKGEGEEQKAEGEEGEAAKEGDEAAKEGEEGAEAKEGEAAAETAEGEAAAEKGEEAAEGGEAPADGAEQTEAAAGEEGADAPAEAAAEGEQTEQTTEETADEAAAEQTVEGGESAEAEEPAPAVEASEAAAESAPPAEEQQAEAADAPSESTDAPAESTEAPAPAEDVPAEQSGAPAEQSEAPAEQAEAPAEQAEAPAEQAEEQAEAPAESAETPVPEQAEAPAESAEAPAESSEAPAAETEQTTDEGEKKADDVETEQKAE